MEVIMKRMSVLVLVGLCTALLAGYGCNRVLPAMEPYDEYKARLKSSKNIDPNALPVLKPSDATQGADTPAQRTEEKK
jgi:hypothetical protein